MDAPVMLFALAVALIEGLLVGVAPAFQATRAKLMASTQQGGFRSTASNSVRRLREGLVVAEVALALVLLLGSGLLMRSFFGLLDVDPGFDSTNVLTAGLPIARAQHPDPRELNAYLRVIRAAIAAVPGVRETALATRLPLQGRGLGLPYQVVGQPVVDLAHRPNAFVKMVSPSYFNTLGMKVIEGPSIAGAGHLCVFRA